MTKQAVLWKDPDLFFSGPESYEMSSNLFESFSIYYKTLELNYFVFETFYLLSFLPSVSRPQGPFDLSFEYFIFDPISGSVNA